MNVRGEAVAATPSNSAPTLIDTPTASLKRATRATVDFDEPMPSFRGAADSSSSSQSGHTVSRPSVDRSARAGPHAAAAAAIHPHLSALVQRVDQGLRHFDRLASVEEQSVMHFLDIPFLCLSRSDADSEVAWRHQAAFHIKIGPTTFDAGRRIRASLLRHAPLVSATWVQPTMFFVRSGRTPSAAVAIDAIVDLPHLTSLKVLSVMVLSERIPIDVKWTRLLHHPSLASLRHLELGGDEDSWWAEYDLVWDGFASDLQHMTDLTTLRMRMSLPYDSSDVMLPHLPNLTTLDLTLLDLNSSAATTVANYTRLTDLTLNGPRCGGFSAFFTSPGLRRLQRLKLEFNPGEGGAGLPSDCSTVFSALTELHTLEIFALTGAEANCVLTSLMGAPSIRHLTLAPLQLAHPSAIRALLRQPPRQIVITMTGLTRRLLTDLQLQARQLQRTSARFVVKSW